MKKPAPTEFERYRRTLDGDEAAALCAFFAEVGRRLPPDRATAQRMTADFEQAILSYATAGVPLSVALSRLAPENLGGFYVRPPVLWYPLDDAAKIYPLSMKHGQMAVFRLAVRLKDPVDPALLQMALIFTVKRFPAFAATVKKGFFWHYLDASKGRPAVTAEAGLPCQALPVAKSGSQAFRVMYHDCRISVEYFHILTDGTGGMVFLKALTAEYLRLRGVSVPAAQGVFDVNEAPRRGEARNAFSDAAPEKGGRSAGFLDRPAVQLGGRLSRKKPCQILHFRIPADALHAAATRCGGTVTAYVLALLFAAGRAATDELAGEMNIQVPVNMRKFHPCETLRNFSLYCGIRLPLEKIGSVADMIAEIRSQLAEKASAGAMEDMMRSTRRLVGLLRPIPLAVKAPVARQVYGFLGDSIFTNTLSNLGVVTAPAEMAAQIRDMDFVLGTAITNRAGCSMVTFGNVATLSVAKLTADPSFEEALLRLLRADGLEPSVEGSDVYDA